MTVWLVFFFFFQAEDGIRDLTVTGVQTCALPICGGARGGSVRLRRPDPQRPQRLRVHARRSGEHPERRAPRGPAAARRRLRLRELHHVLPRLPAPPVRGGGGAGGAAAVAALR